jgi:hypothetical protein
VKKQTVMGTGLLVLVVLGIGCAVVWRNMSRKYILRWDIPKEVASKPLRGNVCVVQHPNGTSAPLACAEVSLFPGVYDTIGADQDRFRKWQDEHGFHSGGVTSDGALLAPGYPILSRLAWTNIDPVYLQGGDLSGLLEEVKRVSEASNDATVRANLDKLSALATKAQQGSQVLRFFG